MDNETKKILKDIRLWLINIWIVLLGIGIGSCSGFQVRAKDNAPLKVEVVAPATDGGGK